MSSERDICLRRADDAKRRATQATEPSIKSAYEKVAEHWMLLARLESLVADQPDINEPMPPSPNGHTAEPINAFVMRSKP